MIRPQQQLSSPSSAYCKRCCKDRPIRFISSRSFSSLGTRRAHTFRNFKRSCIMLHAKPCEHPSAVDTLPVVILLSAQINSSTRCTVASVAVSTGRPGRTLSANFELLQRIYRPSCERFTSQTLPNVNRTHFFMNILCIESFCPQKIHNTTLLFGL
jgi:hypothetical protein